MATLRPAALNLLRFAGFQWIRGWYAGGSTKNKEGKRDLEMHQMKKGNRWCFGINVHVALDKNSGLNFSVWFQAANAHDLTLAAGFCLQ